MDENTILAYNAMAAQVANLHDNLIPLRIYELINQYFIKYECTADIGCGIGRDSAWLASQGYSTVGVDASIGMLKQARARYPDISFKKDELPTLGQQKDGEFVNVLCSAVIMHLPSYEIGLAVKNLSRITRTDGVVIISYRGTCESNERENGKLYTKINSADIVSEFVDAGMSIVHFEIDIESSRGIEWSNFVFKKLRPLVV